MRREIPTETGTILVSGDPDGPVMIHTPARRPAVLSPDEARRLGRALLIAAPGHGSRVATTWTMATRWRRTKGQPHLDWPDEEIAHNVRDQSAR